MSPSLIQLRVWYGIGCPLWQVEELLERGVYDMKELADGRWVTALRYEDEVISDLKKRTGGKDDKVRAVTPWASCTGCPLIHCLFQIGNHSQRCQAQAQAPSAALPFAI